MAGLLDFLQTPQGIGLLSGVASYAANARRGTPVNNVGRGLAGGLVGYQQANNQTDANASEKQQRELRDLQIQQSRQQIEQIGKQNAWRAGLPGVMQKAKGTLAHFEADNPFGEDLGTLMTGAAPEPNAIREYLTQPDSPYLDDLFKDQIKGTDPAEKFGKVMPHAYTPESLAAYSQSGNYADLKPIGGGQGDFGKVNPGQFTPESLARYAETGMYGDLVPFRSPVQIDQGDRKTLFDPGRRTNTSYEVSPGPESLPEFRAAQTTATENAKAGIERGVDAGKKARGADALLSGIDQAEAILKTGSPSGSVLGTGLSAAKRVVGMSDNTTQSNEQLRLLSGWMVANVPRMEGPQSNFDVQNYRDMAARVGDSTVPREDRLSALSRLRELQNKYKSIQQDESYKQVPISSGENEYIMKRRNEGATDDVIAKELQGFVKGKPAQRATGTYKDPFTVNSDADYNSVPKGKYYKAPDGSIRVRK